MPDHLEDEAGDLEDDARHAEALLYDLATVLRCVPLGSHTRALHVRALELKRDVCRWPADRPAPSARRAALEELVGLRREAAMWLPHGGAVAARQNF